MQHKHIISEMTILIEKVADPCTTAKPRPDFKMQYNTGLSV